MQPSRPFQPDGLGGAELFADPEAYTSAYHDARARELERRAAAAANTALANTLLCVARRHDATALALAADAEPARRGRRVAAWPRSAALSSSAGRSVTARSA
jgi:hypothetical protein